MKKLILLIGLVFCISGSAYLLAANPGFMGAVGGVESAGTTCTSWISIDNDAGAGKIGNSDDEYYRGLHLDGSGQHDICRVTVELDYSTGDISAKLYSVQIYKLDGSDALDVKLGESDDITGDNGWTSQTVTFTFSPSVTVNLDADDIVVIVGLANDAESSPTDYAATEYTGAEHADVHMGRWAKDGTENFEYANNDMDMTIYTDQ